MNSSRTRDTHTDVYIYMRATGILLLQNETTVRHATTFRRSHEREAGRAKAASIPPFPPPPPLQPYTVGSKAFPQISMIVSLRTPTPAVLLPHSHWVRSPMVLPRGSTTLQTSLFTSTDSLCFEGPFELLQKTRAAKTPGTRAGKQVGLRTTKVVGTKHLSVTHLAHGIWHLGLSAFAQYSGNLGGWGFQPGTRR